MAKPAIYPVMKVPYRGILGFFEPLPFQHHFCGPNFLDLHPYEMMFEGDQQAVLGLAARVLRCASSSGSQALAQMSTESKAGPRACGHRPGCANLEMFSLAQMGILGLSQDI